MGNNEKIKELEELLHASMFSFEAEIFLLKKLWKLDINLRINQIKALLLSSSSTWWVIIFCWKNPLYFSSEWLMLSRAFIEKIINFIYLLSCTQDEYDRFLLHPYYRQYHNFSQKKEAWNISIWISFSWLDEYKKIPVVKRALAVFSETNARLDWSAYSIHNKVKVIGENGLWNIVTFLLSTLTIYTNSSEALHWSFYWVAQHLWVFDPTINSKDEELVYENVLRNLILIFANLTFLSHEVFLSINKIEFENKDKFSELYDMSSWLLDPQFNILKSMTKIS